MIDLMKSSPRHQYQTDTREFNRGKPKIGDFIWYGGGKSYLALQWIADLIAGGANAIPALILCPNSLIKQWGDQIEMHSNFSYSVVDGSLSERREALQKGVDIYVAPYSSIRTGLRGDLNVLAAQCFTIIADESTYLKSAKTLRFKLCQYNFINIPNRALLTGKPMTERIQDLWSQMLFLDGGVRLGSSEFNFIKENFDNDMWVPFKKVLKPGAEESIASRLKDICISVPREKVAAQLPPQTIIPVYFEMPKKAREKYAYLKKHFQLELDADSGLMIDTQWILVKNNKLQQICNGFVYADWEDEDGARERITVTEDFDCLKFDWLTDALPDIIAQGPVLLWAFHRETIRALSVVLSEMKIDYLQYMGGGDKSIIDQFKEGKGDVLLLSTSAGFAGFNLFRAKSAIFFSLGPSGDMRDNALARNHRMGSEIHSEVVVYDLIVTDSVDAAQYKALITKSSVSEAVLKHLTQD